METSDLSNKQFKVIINKDTQDLRRIDEHKEKFNKELQNTKNTAKEYKERNF